MTDTLPSKETECKDKSDDQHLESSQIKSYPCVERTFLTFSDESTFRKAYRLRKRKPPQRSYCLITRFVFSLLFSFFSSCPVWHAMLIFVIFFAGNVLSIRTQQLGHHFVMHQHFVHCETLWLFTWNKGQTMTLRQCNGWNTSVRKERRDKQQHSSLHAKSDLPQVCRLYMLCRLFRLKTTIKLQHHLHKNLVVIFLNGHFTIVVL